eukprot:jgi/Mesvir1/25110/Mv21574-RA.1
MERAVAEEAEEGGGLDPPADFRPRLVVDMLVKSVAPYAHNKGVDLWVAFSPAVPHVLHGRAAYVHKVLGYLIENAVNATSKGDVCVTIGVTSASGNGVQGTASAGSSQQGTAQASPYASIRDPSILGHSTSFTNSSLANSSLLAASSSGFMLPNASTNTNASSQGLSSMTSGNNSASISHNSASIAIDTSSSALSASGPPSSAILIPSPSMGRFGAMQARTDPPGGGPSTGPGLSRRSSLDSLMEASDGEDWELADAASRSVVLEFRVEDSGCGIAGSVQQELSRGLRRGDPYSSKHFGRGLTTALAIVSQAGGRILFDSKVGAGTTFRFTLPFELPAPPTPTVGSGHSMWERNGSGSESARDRDREGEALHSARSDPTPLLQAAAASGVPSACQPELPPGRGDGAPMASGAGAGGGGSGVPPTSLPSDIQVLVALDSVRGRTLLQALLEHWGAREVIFASQADALAHAVAEFCRAPNGCAANVTLLLDLAMPSLPPLVPALIELKAKGGRFVGLVKAGRTGIQEAERLFVDCRLGLVVTRPWNAEELLQALTLVQDETALASLGPQATPRNNANAILSADQWHELVLSNPHITFPSPTPPSAPTAVQPSRSFTRSRVRGGDSPLGMSSAPPLPIPSSPPPSRRRTHTDGARDLASVPFLGGASSPASGMVFAGFNGLPGASPPVPSPAKDTIVRRNSVGTLLPGSGDGPFRLADPTRRSTVGGGSTPVYAQQYLSGGGGAVFGLSGDGLGHGGESERRPVRSTPITPMAMHGSSSSSVPQPRDREGAGTSVMTNSSSSGALHSSMSGLSMSGHLRFLHPGAPGSPTTRGEYVDSPTQAGGSSSSGGGMGGGASPALTSSPSVRRRAPQRQLSENFGTMLKKLFAADRGAGERGATPTSVTPPSGYPGLSLAVSRTGGGGGGGGERGTRSDEASPCGVGGMNIAQQLRAVAFGDTAVGGLNPHVAFGSDRSSPGGSTNSSAPGSCRLSFDKEGEKEADGKGGSTSTSEPPSSPRRSITLPSLSAPFARLRKAETESQRGAERFSHVGSGQDLLRMGPAGGTDAFSRTAGAELFCPTPSMEGVAGGGMYSHDGGWAPGASMLGRAAPSGGVDDEIRY